MNPQLAFLVLLPPLWCHHCSTADSSTMPLFVRKLLVTQAPINCFLNVKQRATNSTKIRDWRGWGWENWRKAIYSLFRWLLKGRPSGKHNGSLFRVLHWEPECQDDGEEVGVEIHRGPYLNCYSPPLRLWYLLLLVLRFFWGLTLNHPIVCFLFQGPTVVFKAKIV